MRPLRERSPVMLRLLVVLLMLAPPAVAQQGKPFAKGDTKAGQAIVEKDCSACHVRRFGDTKAIYTRVDRRVNTPAQLQAQIAYCNSELGAGYFPEEEEHIAAYLNLMYYKFEQ